MVAAAVVAPAHRRLVVVVVAASLLIRPGLALDCRPAALLHPFALQKLHGSVGAELSVLLRHGGTSRLIAATDGGKRAPQTTRATPRASDRDEWSARNVQARVKQECM